MKTRVKYALVIFLTVAFTETEAQIRSGYIFGVNLSSLSLKTKGISSYPETQGGIHLGGFYEVPLSKKFIFQPSLLFSAKGSSYVIDTIQSFLSPIYIEIPAIIAYRFGSDAVKIYLFAGPYFACGIGGLSMDKNGNLKDIRFGSGENKDLKPFDIGFNLGAGVNIRGLLISAQYGIGMVNISPLRPVDSEMKNKVVGISISFYSHAN
jgi:hypothetical protein